MPPWVRFVVVVAVFAVVVLVSALAGVPDDGRGREALPAVALEWPLLFHVLRGSALLATVGLVLLIAWRGAHGDWPIKFANVEYAPKEAVAVTADAIAKQDRRLRLLEAHVGLDDVPIENDRADV